MAQMPTASASPLLNYDIHCRRGAVAGPASIGSSGGRRDADLYSLMPGKVQESLADLVPNLRDPHRLPKVRSASTRTGHEGLWQRFGEGVVRDSRLSRVDLRLWSRV